MEKLKEFGVAGCMRCGGILQSTAPRTTIEGKTYHFYCAWKLEQQKKYGINNPEDRKDSK